MNTLPIRSDVKTVTYHRNVPTAYELKFGEGCVHYMDFDIDDVRKPDGRLKRWTVGPDGLRYYR
jgi:hypothetical protein